MDDDYLKWLMGDVYGFEDTSPDLPSWHASAACRDRPDVTWFPERGADHRPAVEVCQTCPVAQECLSWAVDHGERDGVWGGLTPSQRSSHALHAA